MANFFFFQKEELPSGFNKKTVIITSVPAAQGTRDMGPSHPTSAPKKTEYHSFEFCR